MNNRQSWNVITLFLILIFGFSLATILKPQNGFSERENRVLATRPEPTVSTVFSGEFEKAYEDSLTDQFVLRDQWIALRSFVERLALKQDIHDVYLGKDSYLIEKHTGTFSTEYAQNNISLLKEFVREASDRCGQDHVWVMMVPNAVSVLTDKLPLFAAPYDEKEYLQKIENELPVGVWVEVTDVLEEAARTSDEQLYYRTDHHWTTYGAYLAYQELALQKGLELSRITSWDREVLTDRFEGTVAARIGSSGTYDRIEAWKRNDRTERKYLLRYNQTGEVQEGYLVRDCLETRDKYGVFFGGNFGTVEIRPEEDTAVAAGSGTGRKLLVIKDSYANCFVPFLLDQFDEVDLVDMRYFNGSLSEYMETASFTDVLFLNNVAGFAEDASLVKLRY